ncbi:helix-turn-helix transcriptional regulator [Citrobacter werkmanii]|uniref:DNA-binding protein n=1 Tax=Salmonella bongori N268-08 TaxID=1197719 RepID=S5N3R5_SALBN|nr:MULTISPECIES: helix-turn-helix transcriptional regulator [Enterobacteriaceae]AGR61693.1 DNA-binding protein [Salmonella bongori N268-08]ECC8733654.1 XRE family transcriptional regulator [Salmonella bongori]ECE6549096.1 XRE family transcriptional regulator [Salmonella bongori]ECI3518096.1 XRE family transcriptional regulator [Salmonella bongori]EDP8577947.1 helix-turn-helix transcriptional regulator [Salmonella bongori]
MSSIYSDEYQLVIKTLRSARIEQGITQTQLAESLGKPQSFVAKVENGERRLDVIEFAVIARLLSLDPAVILNAVMK